jgi:uncharacterized coiled-coil protein SlyX
MQKADIMARRRVEQEQIKREETSLMAKEKELKDAQKQAESHKQTKTLPPPLQRKLEDAEQSVKDSKKQLAEYEATMAQINAKFDQSMARFRELNGSASASASVSASASSAASASAKAASK